MKLRPSHKRRLPLQWIIVGVVVVAALATAAVFAKKYYDLQAATPTAASEAARSEALAKKVGRLIMLPEGETPVIGEISDVEKLKDQAFFDKAQKGDQLLIYQQAQRAYIYREKDNILVNAGDVNTGEVEQANQ